MKRNQFIVLVILIAVSWSCRNDDDGLLDAQVIPPKTLVEAATEDDAAIKAFLETHFYNYEEFENPPSDFDFKIRFDTIAGDNADKKPIMDDIKTETVLVESSFFGRTDEEEFNHILYYLEIEGLGGEGKPTIGDYSIMQYEGMLLNKNLFDARSNTPVRFYLSDPGLRLGFARVMTKLGTGSGPIENGDGTVRYDNFGVGAVFMPSGLAYFSNPPQASIIPAYAPLIFTLQAMSFEMDTDFDGDGIPSILEDLNGDGNLNNDNTDGDTEPAQIFLPNHNDTDDDQDGIPTIEEIELDADGNFVGFKDTDGDGIFDHLDNDN